MDKKALTEELNYIFNVIKSSFDPIGFARYLKATNKWDTYIKGIAKSHGLKIKSELNIDKLIDSKVESRFSDELAPDQIEDLATWIKIKIFYPKAEERVEEEKGVDLSHGKRERKDIFEVLKKEKDPEAKDLSGLEGKFVNLIKSMTSNLILNYLDEQKRKKEQLGDQVLIKDIDEDGLENDLDRLSDSVDVVEDIQYKELVEKATEYIKAHGNDTEKKVFDLRMKELSFEEIAEKLKLSNARITQITKQIRKILHDFSMQNDYKELREKIEKMMDRFKETSKKSAEETLDSVVSKLESLFYSKKENNPKIAKIAEYIDTLSFRIQTDL